MRSCLFFSAFQHLSGCLLYVFCQDVQCFATVFETHFILKNHNVWMKTNHYTLLCVSPVYIHVVFCKYLILLFVFHSTFSCTFCILSCCNKCVSSLCPGVSLWFSSGDCPHGNKKTFWQPVTIQCYTLTLFSCPTGRRMTVPVTLMTDSTVRLHSTAFKWLADLKQKEIC